MAEAIRLSMEGLETGRGGPFGAVVVKDGRIVGRGNNQVTGTNDPTAHAEMVAIREACRNLGTFQLGGCTLYCSCEPCPMCLGAIYWARPDQVFFAATREDAAQAGFDDAFIYKEIPLSPGDRKYPLIPLGREEALAAFRFWKGLPDKTGY